MSKLRVKPTLEESFAVGKLEGTKEAFEEIQEMIKNGIDGEVLSSYLKGRIKGLYTTKLTNPFKRD